MPHVLAKLLAYINYPRRGFPRYGVDRFMKKIAKEVPAGAVVLDAGAGNQPYRKLFNHVKYESCDYQPVLKESGEGTDTPQTFYCDLQDISKPDNSYDAIICNQVLEHVKKPDKVIGELFRVLKPGGRLFLTTPQCSGIHMPPHNYFNFISFGLKYLFEQGGFQVLSIEPLGGIFWVQGKVMQKSYEAITRWIRPPFTLLFIPVDLIMRILLMIVAYFLFYLDRLDTEKGWTLGYGCCCVKPRMKGTI